MVCLILFALAGLAGYQVVWGVAPALHSPLMAVTNAISGMTAVGGLLLLSHHTTEGTGLIPDTTAHWFGAVATLLSFINIAGGFLVSGKMLDLFRRPTDPDEYFGLYTIPSLVLVGSLLASQFLSVGSLAAMSGTVAIVAGVSCIAGIAALSSQKTARTGNVLSMTGVALGLAATTADMQVAGATATAFGQAGILSAVGASIGSVVASGVGPTELPQTVAAFHSLVGLAAMAGAAGEFLGETDLGAGTLVPIYLATLIGAVTFSGSIVAFGKLSGKLDSAPLKLPGRDQYNLAMLSICILGMAAFLNPELAGNLANVDPSLVQTGALGLAAVVSTVLGWHLTASIGGKLQVSFLGCGSSLFSITVLKSSKP